MNALFAGGKEMFLRNAPALIARIQGQVSQVMEVHSKEHFFAAMANVSQSAALQVLSLRYTKSKSPGC